MSSQLSKINLLITCFFLASVTLAQDITLNAIGTYRDGAFDESAAEIVSYDPKTQRVFLINGDSKTVDILDISDPTSPELIKSIDVTPYGGGANSVDVNGGRVAVAVEAEESTNKGKVVLFDTDGNFLKEFPAGSLPDGLAFSPNGKMIVVANEGEPNDEYTIDPEGSITVIYLGTGKVKQLNFRKYNRHKRLFKLLGIRIFGPNASVAQDLEPEFVAISEDSRYAYITLQENNAYALVDLKRGAIRKIIPFGYKNHRRYGHGIDASNDDDAINIQNWPVFGMYLPDAIATYNKNGKTFILTANEGDSRDYDGFSEEERVKDLTLNPYWFANPEELQKDENLGRLKVTNTMGKGFFGGDEYAFLFSYGTRSFSIWKANNGRQVFDSGEDFERITAERIPDYFNSNNDDNDSFDSRSDDKGPEPEAIEVASLNGRDYAFIGLERVGGIMIYDITNPYRARFVDYINNRNFEADAESAEAGDLGVEDLRFVSAKDSPNGRPLLISGNEVSGTVTIFEITIPGEEDEVLYVEEVKAYPVPLRDQLNIDFPTPLTGNVRVVLQDPKSGKTILEEEQKIQDLKSIKMDISAINRAGLYVLTVILPDGEVIRKSLVK